MCITDVYRTQLVHCMGDMNCSTTNCQGTTHFNAWTDGTTLLPEYVICTFLLPVI